MRAVSFICKFLMWGFLGFYLIIQALTVYSLTANNLNAIKAEQPDKVYGATPLIAAAVIMLAAVILFTVFRRHRYIGTAVAVVAAALMLVIALDLGRAFPSSIGAGGNDVGLSTWKLVWRHMGIAVIPLFMLCAWLSERSADKADRKYMSEKKGYDLSGQAIFTDYDESGGVITSRRLKRSVRKRIESRDTE